VLFSDPTFWDATQKELKERRAGHSSEHVNQDATQKELKDVIFIEGRRRFNG
jgi:hypothetical protein